MKVREFKVEDLFIKKTMRGCPKSKENLAENKDGYYIYGQNIKRQHPQKVLLDEIYLHKVEEKYPILAYSSSVGEIGMIEESFYRSGNNGAFQGLFPKIHKYTKNEILYLLTVLKQHFAKFTYSTSMSKILELGFMLPIQTDTEGNPIVDLSTKYHSEGYVPDFEYMEKFISKLEQECISELEQERISELEQYLKVVGLENYELTEEDRNVLKSDEVEFKEFKIEDIFNKPNLKWKSERKFDKKTDISKEKTNEFSLPLVNAKFGNNGIMYWGREEDFDYVEGGIDIISDGAVSAGSVYPQPHRVGVLYNAYIITLKDNIVNREIFEYLSCVLEKSIKYLFGYEYKATWDKVRKIFIPLPIKKDKEGNPLLDKSKMYHEEGYMPDFEYMEKYIKAIEKTVIEDVVKYKDEVIDKTKDIVKNSNSLDFGIK